MAYRPGWMGCLAVAASLDWGGAAAAPADCLTYRDNPHVAACANQYGPSGPSRRPEAPLAATPVQSIRLIGDAELKSVSVVIAAKAPPATPTAMPETPSFTVDRQILTNTVVVGALAGTLLILVALGFWRWGASLMKDCPWCASKISRAAHTCPRCFRTL